VPLNPWGTSQLIRGTLQAMGGTVPLPPSRGTPLNPWETPQLTECPPTHEDMPQPMVDTQPTRTPPSHWRTS